ncbi:hypothetical protein KQH82_00420 [bacterium]|nr:hypothetical protein [bacterium]
MATPDGPQSAGGNHCVQRYAGSVATTFDVEFDPVVGAQATQQGRRSALGKEADLRLYLEVERILFDLNNSCKHVGWAFGIETGRRVLVKRQDM